MNVIVEILKVIIVGFFDSCWQLYGPDEFALAVVVFFVPYLIFLASVLILFIRVFFSIFRNLYYTILRRYYRRQKNSTFNVNMWPSSSKEKRRYLY